MLHSHPIHDIGHVDIRPTPPQLNGKVEPIRRIDSEELNRLLEGQVVDDANLFSFKRRNSYASGWSERILPNTTS